jgi:hypothetical protein
MGRPGKGGLPGGAAACFAREEPVMSDNEKPVCPECAGEMDLPEVEVDRRNFIRVVGGTSAALALGGVAGTAPVQGAAMPARKPKPAEELVKELHSTLNDRQKKRVVLDWDDGKERGRPTRLGMYNNAIKNIRIGGVYTKPQQELIVRILKSISSGDDGYRRISRGGTWDMSRSLGNCGALIFGDPTGKNKYSWVFSGHHLTVRCDGNSEEGAAFGGPMYYGHSPNGYSRSNLFNYQTRSVLSVYKALSEKQRETAVVKGSPGEMHPSVRFKKRAAERPGILYKDLTADQQKLVEKVMRDVLSPYRKEDVDEVFDIIKKNGGMEKIKLAFYPDRRMDDDEPWHFWRLEGPGFVWNYRVLPHVHTYVNISSKI